jgi:hypothetical protein
MSDYGTEDDGQNRRRFLQLLGASGVAAGSFGANAAATGSSELSVELLTSAENYCDEGFCPPDINHPVPVGSEIEFQAIVDGEYTLAEVKKDEVVTAGAETILTCGEGEDNDLHECDEFTVEFDDTGVYEIRFEAWSDEGTIGTPMSSATTSGLEPVGDCEEFDALSCDSITFRVFDPEIDLSVEALNGSEPYEVNDTLIFTADVDPSVEPSSWTLDSIQIDDEPAEVIEIEAPEAGEVWARRPLTNGTWIVTATAEYDGLEFQESIEVEVQPKDSVAYSDAEITQKYDTLFGSVDLSNGTDEFRIAKVDLRTFGDGDETLDSQKAGLTPGEQQTVEVDGECPSEAFYAALYVDGESVESKEL